MVWLVSHKFLAFWRKTSEALQGRSSEIFRGSSQIVVWAGHTSRSSIQLSDPIDKLLHVFNVGVWGILRVNFRRIQNNDLNPIRSECFQGSRQASRLIRSLTEVGNTPCWSNIFATINIFLSSIVSHLQFLQPLLELPLATASGTPARNRFWNSRSVLTSPAAYSR